ncbi:hypothetical protein PXK00_17890 [Phaeobacter sp. QD34_3]|uniref:hypothetical protein n=1 Tax=unclassified Phaeobacter TaxID=2621772 RepID=UPI00237FA9EB|nr:MULTISPECIES: hypothetical protein [unclassified Phaeobacter]MDE4134986.1 hypothetical protein [Phaeobacter sp. QD34_3]MDE4138616.1 hypothetical protein [Phaeobacter sp. QD34_24]MDE4176672.1 hypothetical protein [Phaeobacter sp. PT47_59]
MARRQNHPREFQTKDPLAALKGERRVRNWTVSLSFKGATGLKPMLMWQVVALRATGA